MFRMKLWREQRKQPACAYYSRYCIAEVHKDSTITTIISIRIIQCEETPPEIVRTRQHIDDVHICMHIRCQQSKDGDNRPCPHTKHFFLPHSVHHVSRTYRRSHIGDPGTPASLSFFCSCTRAICEAGPHALAPPAEEENPVVMRERPLVNVLACWCFASSSGRR